MNKKIQDVELIIRESRHRLSEIDKLVKRLLDKFVNDKTSEEKFYKLEKSYDFEKIALIKSEQDSKKQLSSLKNIEDDVETLYDLITSKCEIEELQWERDTIHRENSNL